MYQYDVETFMCACDRKGLAAKTMKSYEQTLRLFGLFLAERGITQTEEIRHPHIEAYIDTVRSRGKYTVCSVQEPSSPNYPERRKDYGKKVSPVTINTLHLSGLPDSNRNDTLEVTIKTTSSVKYPEPIAADKTRVYYTGEAAVTTLIISNPSSAKIENDDGAIVRLYMDFDGQGGKPQLAVGEYTIGVNSGTTYTYKVSQISGTNIYCFEVQRPRNGDTITLNLESGYASPTTGGGSNRIFGTILSKEDKENLQGNELPYIDQYQNLQWKTKVDRFPVTKKRVDQKVEAKGDGNGHAHITGLSYEIDTPREGDTLEGIGKDLMTSTDYTDVLTLPEGITIDEKALRAIQTNNYTWRVTFRDSQVYHPPLRRNMMKILANAT